MATNLLSLFDDSHFERRKTPVQTDFEQKNKDFLIEFRAMPYSAHQDLQTKIWVHFKPNEMDKNANAVMMISFIRQNLIRQFPLYCSQATPGRFMLVTPSGEHIYVKKLDDDKMPSNIPTVSNTIILMQLSENKSDDNPNIFLGYTTTDTYSDITGTYAVCITGSKVDWISDLSNLDNEQQGDIIPLTPVGIPPVALKEGVVKIKTNKRE